MPRVGVDRFTRKKTLNIIIYIPYEGYVTFEKTVKFLIVFVRLVLRKVGVDRFTGARWESDIR